MLTSFIVPAFNVPVVLPPETAGGYESGIDNWLDVPHSAKEMASERKAGPQSRSATASSTSRTAAAARGSEVDPFAAQQTLERDPVDWNRIRRENPGRYWNRCISGMASSWLIEKESIVARMLCETLPCDVELILPPRRGVEEDLYALTQLNFFPGVKDAIREVHQPVEGTIRFGDARRGLTFPYHAYTKFRVRNAVLYFPVFDSRHSGCTIVAYDLRTYEEIWRHDLRIADEAQDQEIENIVVLRQGGDRKMMRSHYARQCAANRKHWRNIGELWRVLRHQRLPARKRRVPNGSEVGQ